jgi:uncharacterized protein YecE (DUF72 family)
MAAIRVGVGGWTYEPWRGAFYPAGLTHKRELEYASGHLTSIEINGTFYGTQKPESFARWHDETPDDFVFALKGPRYATNRRVLAEAGQSVDRFLASGILELKDKLGPINWQFAPTKKFDPADFEGFLKCLPAEYGGRRLRHAVELRHPSFAADEAVALARRYGVAIVVAGDSDYPHIDVETADFAYARIMGTTEAEPLGYAPAALDRWADQTRRWAASGRDVFLYVISGHKVLNPAAAQGIIARL